MSALAGVVARLVYYVVLTPAGLVSRLVTDPLGMRRAPERSNWCRLPPADASLDAARRES